MSTDDNTIAPETDLITVAKYFVGKKASCLPVVSNRHLQGIVTSVDFVKLSLQLLEAKN